MDPDLFVALKALDRRHRKERQGTMKHQQRNLRTILGKQKLARNRQDKRHRVEKEALYRRIAEGMEGEDECD